MKKRCSLCFSIVMGILLLFFCDPLAAKTVKFKFSNFVPPVEPMLKRACGLRKN